MDSVREWATALCLAAVVCTVLQMLMPEGKNKRLSSTIIGCFFLCCLLSPVLRPSAFSVMDWTSNVIADAQANPSLANQLEYQLKIQTENQICRLCDRFLKNYEVKVHRASVDMDTEGSDAIYITGVTLYVDESDKSQSFTVKTIMERQLGVPVTVETE